MPRFFFHLHNDLEVLDAEGNEFPSAEAARRQAEREARVMASEAILSKGRLVLSHSIEVTDESGGQVAVVRFGDVVTVES
jgi:hypothetical protein